MRYSDIAEQIQIRTHSFDMFADGVKRFAIGLAKKVIIANQVALAADSIFGLATSDLTVLLAWLGALTYMIQIYFDFSGYSDMAIGLGKMFGFKFLENFNYPYISQSITEFWRRWHISLSSWFRDYIYIPLGGNRTGNVYVNLSVVFLVTGLWHGAAWTFVLWGIWHGIFILIERVGKQHNIQLKLPIVAKWFYTMLVVIIGWVLFRSNTLGQALDYLRVMFGFSGQPIFNQYTIFMLKENAVLLVFASLFSTPVVKKAKDIFSKTNFTDNILTILSPCVYLVVLIVSIAFTVTSTYNPFIYFNF